MRQGGKLALQEGRHGHPAKLRGEVRQWLEETCRQAPYTPSHEIQVQLAKRFALPISVSQLNRVRATLGVSNPPQSAKKK
jgi:transposase